MTDTRGFIPLAATAGNFDTIFPQTPHIGTFAKRRTQWYNCIYRMQYEWDEEKNKINQEKHGISFEIAALVFEDERCLVLIDRVDKGGEQRWHAIGAASIEPAAAVVLLVVHVYREDIDGEEITRIISARRAEKNEIRRYQEQNME
jgi:uncharacterized protein